MKAVKYIAVMGLLLGSSVQFIYAGGVVDESRRAGLSFDVDPNVSSEQWDKWAKLGNAPAQMQMGYFYLQGTNGENGDAQRASEYFKDAATQGNIEAMNALGALYFSGEGNVKKDFYQAIDWWTKAADLGDINALNFAARMLGEKGDQGDDARKAVELFEKGVKKHSAESAFCLGVCKLKGIGCEANPQEAEALFQKAGEWGYSTEAMGGFMDVAEFPTHPESYYLKLRMKQLEEKANQGDNEALYQLGLMYGIGVGGSPDEQKAVECYRQAAEKGSVEAMMTLSELYSLGMMVPESPTESQKWLKAAAQAGSMDAQHSLGRSLLIGNGTDQDINQAMQWLSKAAAQGDASSQYQWGIALFYGDGTEKNRDQGVEWLKKAALQGYVPALDLLEKLGEL